MWLVRGGEPALQSFAISDGYARNADCRYARAIRIPLADAGFPNAASGGRFDNAMKVVVLCSLAYSLTNFRGNLLRAMRANGHQVIAVAPDYDPAVAKELADSGIVFRVIPMQRAAVNPFADIRLLVAYFWLMLRERPQLVLAYTQKPIIYGGLASRLAAVPRFYALMTGLGHVFSAGSSVNPAVRRLAATLYRTAIRRARAIFVFNADDRKDMIALGIIDQARKVIRVPGSGVDLAKFEARPVPAGPPLFLMIARLLRNKGIAEFAEASALVGQAHPDARFAVLGHLDDQNPEGFGRAEIAEIARRYPVDFLAGTSDVRPCLADAAVFVLPSYYREGLPRTILEAMATGRAVITTDQPGCRDPIEEGGNGFLVPPRDPRALAAAMIRFAEDPMLAVRMGARSREIAEASYSDALVNRMLLDAMDLAPASYRFAPRQADSTPADARLPGADAAADPVV